MIIYPNEILAQSEKVWGGYIFTARDGTEIGMTTEGQAKPMTDIHIPTLPFLDVEIYILPYTYRQRNDRGQWTENTIIARGKNNWIAISPHHEGIDYSYLIWHELGHITHHQKLNFNLKKMSTEFRDYMRLRGISNWGWGEGTAHSKRAEEVFADDFAHIYGGIDWNTVNTEIEPPEDYVRDFIQQHTGGEELNIPLYIIVHHSATKTGNAQIFRKAHKAKGWRDIGYHYVIGNGTDSGDGEIELGRGEHETGAHAKGYNDNSIGICLVGDFDTQTPTKKQTESLVDLCRSLMRGYSIQATNILGHGEVNATNCPGKNFDIMGLRSRLGSGKVEGKTILKLKIGGKEIIRDGKDTFFLDVPAKIENGRTLVPVRAICEAIGGQVDYDPNTQEITITL